MAMKWTPCNDIKMLYSGNAEHDEAMRCIGHLRGDFGRDGNNFWTSWYDHVASLKCSNSVMSSMPL